MYSFLHGLLADRKGGEIFTLFSGWHFLYIFLTVGAATLFLHIFKNKSAAARHKLSKLLINISFGLYIADLFLMPLSYGEIDIEKLPFHVCTAMCVICFLSYHSVFLEKYRTSFLLLGFISNLVYLIYPAGVMWHAIHPLSYRVIQTLLFHSVMTLYGFLTLIYERERLNIRYCYRDLAAVGCMTLWAMLGNFIYNGVSEGYSHFFNWFFVVRDPFYLLPEAIAPFIMPFLNTAIFFAAEILLHLTFMAFKKPRRSPRNRRSHSLNL